MIVNLLLIMCSSFAISSLIGWFILKRISIEFGRFLLLFAVMSFAICSFLQAVLL